MARYSKQLPNGQWISVVKEGTEAQGKPLTFRLPFSLDQRVRAKKNRSAWLAEVVEKALKEECGTVDSEEETNE